MIDRVEVSQGPGTVIRFGGIVAWAGSPASPALISFLAQSARNLGPSPVGGQQISNHITAVLTNRDPEPGVPFLVVGPSEEGWAAVLHGPVQVWDGLRWISPPRTPGWLQAALEPRPTLSVNEAGWPAPTMSPDSTWGLEAGVVPGAGFVLVPAVTAAPLPADREASTVIPPDDPVPAPAPEIEPESQPGPAPGLGLAPILEPDLLTGAALEAAPEAQEPEPEPQLGNELEPELETEAGAEAEPRPEAEPEPIGPQGSINLARLRKASMIVPYPPLPPGRGPDRSIPGSPIVAGVLCAAGHLNRPGMEQCARCGDGVVATATPVSGTRPALGCLVVDDGWVIRLDQSYLVGSNPTRDPTVRGGLALPLALTGGDVSAAHAEIRLHDWDVVVTDRASPSGTAVFEPGGTEWQRLVAYQPHFLKPGTHVAFGQRIVTFVTPWVVGS